MPNSAAELDTLRTSLRRMGHIIEHSPGNVYQSVRQGQSQNSSAWVTMAESRNHSWSPWQNGDHPDGHVSQSSSQFQQAAAYPEAWSSQPSQHPESAQSSHAYPAFQEDLSGTDTDTSSDYEETWDHHPEQFGSPEEESAYAQELFWAYSKAKRQWRSFMGRPTRRVRRFVKREFKGKGKGFGKKGKDSSSSYSRGGSRTGTIHRTAFLADLTDTEMQSLFPAAVGKGRTWRKSSGKGGKGRKGNPKGPDGKVMTCHECGSTEHLVARCPRRRQQGSGDAPTLFVHRQQPLLSTQPPTPGEITHTTVLMVAPGNASEVVSDSSWSQVDPWTNAQHPAPTTQPQPRNPWQNYRPPQGPPVSYGPMPVSPPAREAQASINEMLGRFYQQGQAPFRHSRQQHHSQQQQNSSHSTVNREPERMPLLQPGETERNVSPSPFISAPSSSTLPTPSEQIHAPQANASAVPAHATALYWQPPPPELPAWALMSSMEFLHGQMPIPPPYESPYQAEVTSSLQDCNQRDIEAFHEAAQLMHLRSDQRPSGTASARQPDFIQSREIDQWHEVGRGTSARNHGSRSRERLELEQRVQEALRRQNQSHTENEEEYASTRQAATASSRASSYDGAHRACPVCLDHFARDETVVRLTCRHKVHEHCWLQAVEAHDDIDPPSCPLCRGPGLVIETFDHPDVPPRTETDAEAFPWWLMPQTDEDVYHASTQLEGSRTSIIVDPGAYTNLVGSNWAETQARLALSAGRKSYKTRLAAPMIIRGVGNGAQSCTDLTTIPIAIPWTPDPATPESTQPRRFAFEAPVVEGAGKELPALLGLKSLTAQNAILQMGEGREMLSFPGPGGYTIEYSPGSVHIPLHRAPSGHLCFRADSFMAGVMTEQEADVLISNVQSSASQASQPMNRAHAEPKARAATKHD